MIELDVVGVRVEVSTSTPMLLLRESFGKRYLSIWIGANEAAAIVEELEGNKAPRPQTHDLMAEILKLSGEKVEGIICAVKDGVFYGKLCIGDAALDARPSDLVALALRAGFKVSCEKRLMDEVGVEVLQTPNDEVERFKEFLDTVTPDDFEDKKP
uniref:bifunctional nuclease family protein n=1 Tax=Vaginimicrobium propionicum TaxID=1871034 RepID=UPI000970E5E5|nr:bifunctional nuclease family protein [Vaginimicrobium propionicum]